MPEANDSNRFSFGKGGPVHPGLHACSRRVVVCQTLAQLNVSQKQLESSLEQVEATHKPFVAFSTEPRNAEEAVLDIGGAVGGLICGYLAGIVPSEKFLTPVPRGILQAAKWEIVFTYGSLSGSKYRTVCAVDNLVLTNVKFERLADQN